MENVAPSGALARRSRQWLQLAFVLVTGGVFIGIIGIALFVIPLAVPANQIYGLYHFIRTLLLLAGGQVAGAIEEQLLGQFIRHIRSQHRVRIRHAQHQQRRVGDDAR